MAGVLIALFLVSGVRLDPTAQLHGLGHTVDGNHIGSIAHVYLLLERHIQDAMECLGHLEVKFVQDFLLGPVVVAVVLDRLKVRAGHAAGIAQEVWNIKDIVLLEVFVRLGRAGAIGTFSHDLDVLRYLLDGIPIDMSFNGSRDQDIAILLDPFFAVFDDIAGGFGLLLVDRTIPLLWL